METMMDSNARFYRDSLILLMIPSNEGTPQAGFFAFPAFTP
jgi:hypothetical protein